MEFKGTKGEWEVTGSYSMCKYSIGNEKETIAFTSVIAGANKNDIIRFKANAKLIAAAPELLKALLTCLSRIEGRSHEPFAILEAKEAINKALN